MTVAGVETSYPTFRFTTQSYKQRHHLLCPGLCGENCHNEDPRLNGMRLAQGHSYKLTYKSTQEPGPSHTCKFQMKIVPTNHQVIPPARARQLRLQHWNAPDALEADVRPQTCRPKTTQDLYVPLC